MRIRLFGIMLASPRAVDRGAASLASLTAAVELPPGEIPWSGVLAVEGVETGDERIIDDDALTWADLPLPLTDNHDRDAIVGRIDTVTRQGATINATGVFDDSDNGREAARQVAAGLRRGLSIDVDMIEGEIHIEEPTDPEGDPVAPDDAVPEIVVPIGGDLFRMTSARIRGAALCTIAAFVEAQITLDVDVIVTDAEAVAAAAADCGCGARGEHRVERLPVVGGAYPVPVRPPAAWFDNPQLAEPTPVAVTPDGRVYGHLAGGDCHIGYTDRCVRVAGDTSRDFSSFNDGVLETADGVDVHVGQITLAGGHADLRLTAAQAAAHYDDTRSAVADVTVGWDEANDLPWFAGALRPGVTEEQVRVLRASGVSGDWRPIGGDRRLIAVLSVNVPGFPVWRTRARVASGQVQALVAAPIGHEGDPEDEFRREVLRRLGVLEGAVGPLAAAGRDALAARLGRQAV